MNGRANCFVAEKVVERLVFSSSFYSEIVEVVSCLYYIRSI